MSYDVLAPRRLHGTADAAPCPSAHACADPLAKSSACAFSFAAAGGDPSPAQATPALAARCASLQEVRTRIDETDRQLVALMAERAQYVRQAARFKRSVDEVAAPSRAAEVIARVLVRAREVGAPAEVVEATYRAMIAAFIQEEAGCFTPPAAACASVPADPATAGR